MGSGFSAGETPELCNEGAISAATTHAVAAGGRWPQSTIYIRTQGWGAPGDGGGALWKRVGGEPSHPGRFQSADGSWWEIAEDRLSVAVFGAIGDGVADDGDALIAAEASAKALRRPLWISAPILTKKNVLIESPLEFSPGGVLKPAAGVRVRLTREIAAPVVRIFDLSEGGRIVLPDKLGEVWAAWWGLDEARTDNEIPLQQAIDALEAYWADRESVLAHSGGIVRLHRGVFRVSGQITQRNLVRLIGVARNYSRLLANPETWSGTRMLLCRNQSGHSAILDVSRAHPAVVTSENHGFEEGAVVQISGAAGMVELNDQDYTISNVTANTYTIEELDSSRLGVYMGGGSAAHYISQFGVRCEELTLNAGGLDDIEEVVAAESWNEHCGLRSCLVLNFRHAGIKIRKAYGGSSLTNIEDTEVSGVGGQTSVGIDADIDFITGFHDLVLTRVTVTGCSAAVSARNSVRVISTGVFVEDAETGVRLGGRARLSGIALKAQRATRVLIGLDPDWNGRVDALSCVQGPAARMLHDRREGKGEYRLYDGEFLPGPVNYPVDGLPIFGGRISGGSAPDKLEVRQLASVTRIGTGTYRCTLAHHFSLGAASNYFGSAWASDQASVACRLTPFTATAFDIECRTLDGVPVDVVSLGFLLHHTA